MTKEEKQALRVEIAMAIDGILKSSFEMLEELTESVMDVLENWNFFDEN